MQAPLKTFTCYACLQRCFNPVRHYVELAGSQGTTKRVSVFYCTNCAPVLLSQ